MTHSLFDPQNAGYVQALYEQYACNPDSVPEPWRRFFAQGPAAAEAVGLLVPEPIDGDRRPQGGGIAAPPAPGGDAEARRPPSATWSGSAGVPAADSESIARILKAVTRATALVQAFRDHGHMLARVDPLGSPPPGHPQLHPKFFGTTVEELEQIPSTVVMREGAREGESLWDALKRLRAAYSGHIGYEFEHLEDPVRVRWLWDQVESGVHTQPLPAPEKVRLLGRLSEVEGFEQFLHRAYLGQKRFSIEGTDMLVPMLDLALEEAAKDGCHSAVLGMAHRGRLNVLTHIIGIPPRDILREFGAIKSRGGALQVAGTGDVKYHHGAEGDHRLPDGSTIRVILAPNPSHLEFVNPVVSGMARAMQHGGEGRDKAQDTSSVVPILIHGDAAFAGEGVVAETLNLGRLDGYTVGGTIHVITNNQVGFTTDPEEARSTRYASDVAKGYDFPIIHVNADQPADCLAAMRLAMAYRAQYRDDVVIDLVGYRRHGHNEADEPSYTQPILYAKIADHPTVRAQFARTLSEQGIVDEAAGQAMEDEVAEALRRLQDEIKGEVTVADAPDAPPPDPERGTAPAIDTRVDFELLHELNHLTLTWPEGFQVHPKLARSLEKRRDGFAPDTKLEWAHAEALAFGSLLREGFVIRLTGQDAQRGTFSQRHLVLHDPRDGAEWTPLEHVGQGRFEIHNSSLSETAVLGFEYGYSVATDKDLVLWEAQFGDFVNVAQPIIDQFVASGSEKWDQLASIGLLLPHGYEGQGPEHSSARLERFLTLCAENNMRVVYPTTPAQYFHLLRRQGHVKPERPLIVMTPKSLLRLPAASSEVRELVDGSFQPVLDDPGVADRSAITRLLLCTGKIYYDLQSHDTREGASHVAVTRVEELYPFPSAAIETLAAAHPKLQEVIWVQEEPRNMGALTFIGPRLRAVVPRQVPLRYIARPERASTAEGKHADHAREQSRILREALAGNARG